MNNILTAFLLTLFAGLSTGLGGAIAVLRRNSNTKFLSVILGFSAGVMIYISMIEIFAEAKTVLSLQLGAKSGTIVTVISFFAGMILIALIDKIIPSKDNPHEVHVNADNKLLRLGVFTALAIGIHNFPEGIATFITGMQDIKIALPIAVAIAIHNIPEGIAVAVPVYYASGSRKKAFMYSLLSGLAEPLGALVAYLILMPFITDVLFGIVFAAVAGIMVFISIDELLPAARAYGEHHLSIYGLIAGMALMAVSLILFM